MASTTRILELASIIQSNTAKFDELLTKQGEPTPSFKVNNTRSKTCALRYEATDEITNSRDHVLEAMDELRALMLGPLGFLHQEVIQTVCVFSTGAGRGWSLLV